MEWTKLLPARVTFRFTLALLALGAGHAATAQTQAQAPHPLGWITLGTQGGPAPTAERSEPANALLVGDAAWLVDCGDGTMERFAAAGYAPPNATVVFISHLHVDHIGGLQGLIALHWFRGSPDSPPVTVYGPPGTDKLVAGIVQSLQPTADIARLEQPGKWSPQDSVKVVIVRGGSDLMLGDVRVRAVQNSHFDNPPGHPQDNGTQSLSYRFDRQGYSIGYTGDTGPSDAVVALERNADLLVSEVTARGSAGPGALRARPPAAATEVAQARDPGATVRPGQRGGGANNPFHFQYQHLSPEAAGKLAAAAGVKHLVYTHLAIRGATDAIAPQLLAQTKQVFTGSVSVAHDLDRF